jgi:hypothetical protein
MDKHIQEALDYFNSKSEPIQGTNIKSFTYGKILAQYVQKEDKKLKNNFIDGLDKSDK